MQQLSYQAIQQIGRAGGVNNRNRQREDWDRKYGKDNWTTGYFYNGEVYSRDEALEKFFHPSYFEFMKKNPVIVQNLINTAKELFNPHAVFTTGVDLQVPAVMYGLKEIGIELKGDNKVPIGSFQVKNWTPKHFEIAKEYNLEVIREQNGYKIKYPKLSYDLSPYKVPFLYDTSMCIEDFWQNYKYLLLIKRP